MRSHTLLYGLAVALLVLLLGSLAGGADDLPRTSKAAESPFSDNTAGVVAYVLIVGLLFALMLVGAFLVLNLGLLSRRREDRTGGRAPSDLGVLKNSSWPEAPYEERMLPAEEGVPVDEAAARQRDRTGYEGEQGPEGGDEGKRAA
jgi:hypothetical protein